MSVHTDFVYFLTDLVEIRYRGSVDFYLKGVNDFFPYILHFCPIWIKVGT